MLSGYVAALPDEVVSRSDEGFGGKEAPPPSRSGTGSVTNREGKKMLIKHGGADHKADQNGEHTRAARKRSFRADDVSTVRSIQWN